MPFQVSCGACPALRADSRRHLAAVLRLVEAGRFDPRRLATTVAPLDEAREVWLEDPQHKLVLTA